MIIAISKISLCNTIAQGKGEVGIPWTNAKDFGEVVLGDPEESDITRLWGHQIYS